VTHSWYRQSFFAVVVLALFTSAHPAAQSLHGSPASLDRQNRHAHLNDFTYLQGRRDLNRFVSAGLLVPITGNLNYRLKDVSFPVARPEVRLFVERLSAQYRGACGTPLVVTSLTRPTEFQPPNASARSVHPTGMALDLHRPAGRACRSWLESTLLALERRQILDATLEHSPVHYHVALFPDAYIAYVASITGQTAAHVMADAHGSLSQTVRRGDTLWTIAHRYGTTISALQQANELPTSVIHPGQVLVIPGGAD
jgi:hypothetical protein